MRKIYALFFIIICSINLLVCISSDIPEQIPWTCLNVHGYAIDPDTGKTDDTEGFGAFDSIMKLFNPSCPTNFDNGGGAFDDNSKYVKEKYNIENLVYDPFMRPDGHNKKILEQIRTRKFDCCTSMSVLNVIDNARARNAHINLCFEVLKENGYAFFKIWSGNGTGIETREKNRYQSNQNANYYLEEINKIFGKENVTLVDEKTIKAIKK